MATCTGKISTPRTSPEDPGHLTVHPGSLSPAPNLIDHPLAPLSPLDIPRPLLGLPPPRRGAMSPSASLMLPIGSSWPRPLTSPLASSSPDPVAGAAQPSASISPEVSLASPEVQFASESPRFSGSSQEEDREVCRIVGGIGGGGAGGGGDCDRRSSPGSGDSLSREDEAGNPRFKTEICRNFKEKGTCLYGNQCQFAHGSDEMRDSGKQNKYKTKLCQKYWIHGYCAYGARCNFLHNEEESGRTGNFPPKKRKASSGSTGGNEHGGDGLDWIISPPSGPGSGISNASGLGASGGVGGGGKHGSLTTAALPPLSALHRPVYGSGRLAAYTHNNNYTWIDTWTKKIVN